MAKAKKLPSGSWRVQVYNGKKPDGKPDYISITAPTEKEANYLALQHQLDFKRRRNPANLTVGEAIDKYIESKSNILSPSTLKEYRSLSRNHYKGIAGIPILKLTTPIIQREVNKLAHLSPKTVRNIHGLLVSALGMFYPEFLIQVSLPKKAIVDYTIPTDRDIRLILREIEGTELEIPILLAAFAGLRRSEICGLDWAHVNLGRHELIIRQSKVISPSNEYVLKRPKSYTSNRIVPIPEFVAEKLRAADKSQKFVIRLSPSQITNRFIKIRNRLGLHEIRFHALRHYYASTMLALNVPDKYAMERMGHSTNNMLKTVYQHTFMDKSLEISAAINSHFENIVSHEISHAMAESP